MSFIAGQVRTSTLALRKLNLVLLGLVVLPNLFALKYWSNFVRGPAPMDAAALAAVDSSALPSRYFVEVRPDAMQPTGYTLVEQTRSRYSNRVRSERKKAEFRLASFGDRSMIVEVPINDTSAVLRGALKRPTERVARDVYESVNRGRVKTATLPVILDARGFRNSGIGSLVVIIPFLALALWNLSKVPKRLNDPFLHPGVQSLKRFGDPRSLAMQIDAEMDAGRGVERIGPGILTPTWLINTYATGFAAAPLQEVAWMYLVRGKVNQAVFKLRDGSELAASGKGYPDLLQAVARRVPWAEMGYSGEQEKRWRTDRAAVLRDVDARYASRPNEMPGREAR